LVPEKDFGAVVPGLGPVISSEYHVLSAGENCKKPSYLRLRIQKSNPFQKYFKKPPVHPLTITKKTLIAYIRSFDGLSDKKGPLLADVA
jgi:hypothetical protein